MTGKTNAHAGTVVNNMLPVEKIGSITHSHVGELQGQWVNQNWSFSDLIVGAVYIIFIDFIGSSNRDQSATIEGETLYANTALNVNASRYSYTFRATKSSITVNTRWYHHGQNWNNDSTVSIFG